ncbi:MAG: thiamine-phosphate kinase [Solirubrobacterales bacterium]
MDEFELIEAIRARLPATGDRTRVGPGDDAAVTEPAGATATTIDAVVEGVHFTLPEFSPAAVGRKALAASLSDLAAMGAEPGEAYVALGLPERFDEDFCLAIADGLGEVAAREGVAVGGGDLSRAPVLIVAVTAVGHEPTGGGFVTRAGARPGDAVAVTGELGGGAAGLRLLGGEPGPGGDLAAALEARQTDPHPRLAAGVALAASGATAMIDVSDGLGADAGHLAKAGGVALEIELDRVPVQAGVEELAGDRDAALELAAGGGEDFELLACLHPETLAAASEAVSETGVELTEIGRVTEGAGVSLRMPDGSQIEPSGFDHLA